MPNDNGVKVDASKVLSELAAKSRAEMFPSFDPAHPELLVTDKIIKCTPNDKCDSLVETSYDTDFVVAASTVSKRDELIALSSGLISIVGDLPSANAIINGVNIVSKVIDTVIDNKICNKTYEFKLTPEICVPPRHITVILESIGSSLVLDNDPTDPDEWANVTLTLSTLGQTKTNSGANDKKLAAAVPLNVSVTIGPSCVTSFSIYGKIDISCGTNGRLFGRSSVSLVKTDFVKFTIKADPCPNEDHSTAVPPKGGGSGVPPEHRQENPVKSRQ